MTSYGASTHRLLVLDVLRALAVLLVLGHHAFVPPTELEPLRRFVEGWQRGGWIGVDLFFVLSGFLISGPLFREHQRYGTIRALLLAPPPAPARRDAKAPVDRRFVRLHHAIFAAVAVSVLALRLGNAHFREYGIRSHLKPTHLRIDALMFGVFLSYLFHYRTKGFWRLFHRRHFWPLIACGLALWAPAFVSRLPETPYLYTAGFTSLYLGSGLLLSALLVRGVPDNRFARAVALVGSRLPVAPAREDLGDPVGARGDGDVALVGLERVHGELRGRGNPHGALDRAPRAEAARSARALAQPFAGRRGSGREARDGSGGFDPLPAAGACSVVRASAARRDADRGETLPGFREPLVRASGALSKTRAWWKPRRGPTVLSSSHAIAVRPSPRPHAILPV